MTALNIKNPTPKVDRPLPHDSVFHRKREGSDASCLSIEEMTKYVQQRVDFERNTPQDLPKFNIARRE